MLLIRWLLCLASLAPGAALAQASWNAPSASAEEPSSISPPPLVPASEEAQDSSSQAEAELPRPGSSGLPSAARISLEVMGGAAGGAISGLLALLVGEAVHGSCGDDTLCIITGVGTTAAAIFVGTPLGVYGAGRLAGGRGSYWSSLLGMAVGTGAGLVVVAAFDNKSEPLQIAGIVTLPVAGAVLGYELWNARQQPESVGLTRGGTAGSSPQLSPLVGFIPAGGIIGGLAGRF